VVVALPAAAENRDRRIVRMTVNETIQYLLKVSDQGEGERQLHDPAIAAKMFRAIDDVRQAREEPRQAAKRQPPKPPESYDDPAPDFVKGPPAKVKRFVDVEQEAIRGRTPLWHLGSWEMNGALGVVALRRGGMPGVVFSEGDEAIRPALVVHSDSPNRAAEVAVLVDAGLSPRQVVEILKALIDRVSDNDNTTGSIPF
jgi:hypothetical protein